jgi:SAM-dependent methyltransferase
MLATLDAAPTLASFRDPAGSVFRWQDRIVRAVHPDSLKEFEAFLATQTARAAVESGVLVGTRRLSSLAALSLALSNSQPAEVYFEHERIPFASYPYEWPPEMLHAAGARTLELALAALDEGFGLKDGTPYNVLFRGTKAVFVDLSSFERRDPRDTTWMAYAQFVRTFLLPLLANRDFGMPLRDTLSSHRDGLEPEALYRCASLWHRMKPPFLGLVSIPKWLGGRRRDDATLYQHKLAPSSEQGQYVLRHVLESCRRQLDSLRPQATSSSTWSGYLDYKSLYSSEQLSEKETFVREALQLARPANVLDVGANEGHFSFLAAHSGSSVVAIDFDPAVVGSIWRRAAAENLDVLPLVVDLARPTPATGWRNQECQSFLDRARDQTTGRFDLVLMLAVAHHMLVTERIPLDDLLALAGDLSREYVLIEFVAPQDPMFQRIVRGRESLYSHLTPDGFEAAAQSRWDLVRSKRITGLHRWLYLYRQRPATI